MQYINLVIKKFKLIIKLAKIKISFLIFSNINSILIKSDQIVDGYLKKSKKYKRTFFKKEISKKI